MSSPSTPRTRLVLALLLVGGLTSSTTLAQSAAVVVHGPLPPPAFRVERQTPPAIKALRWGGMALAASGLLLAGGSFGAYLAGDRSSERYDRLRLANDIGWGIWGVGTVMHVGSWFYRSRDRADTRRAGVLSGVQLQLSTRAAQLSVRY